MAQTWPVIDGNFVVGDRDAPVAICTLTTEALAPRLATIPGVAISGQVYTANLGLERIILNVTSNPAIRFLMLCGKDSKLFRPGRSLAALIDEGIDGEGRIVGANGYEPVLPNIRPETVGAFRRQVELIDWTGEDDPSALQEEVTSLAARNPGPFAGGVDVDPDDAQVALPLRQFVEIRPGGRRQPLQYDPKGYFVISIDRDEEQIVLQHFLPDHSPAHEMRGRMAESMLLGLLREDVISQLSHAGYLGGELAKAEAALHLDLRYRQDRPLARMPVPQAATEQGESTPEGGAADKPMPRISAAQTVDAFRSTDVGETVDVVLQTQREPSPDELTGIFLTPSEKSPFNVFHCTEQTLSLRWSEATRVIMGEPSDVLAGGIFRASGVRAADNLVEASAIVVLTKVATIE